MVELGAIIGAAWVFVTVGVLGYALRNRIKTAISTAQMEPADTILFLERGKVTQFPATELAEKLGSGSYVLQAVGRHTLEKPVPPGNIWTFAAGNPEPISDAMKPKGFDANDVEHLTGEWISWALGGGVRRRDQPIGGTAKAVLLGGLVLLVVVVMVVIWKFKTGGL